MAEADAPRPLTIGTAGHIDHGKTALVAALTGTDTDRLDEERRRGISIELGYARLDLPEGGWLSVVDVPGHERLVRTMVAGATGIDLFLLVIAADDGVMPQTREHVAVLRALGIERGVIALTKGDLVDEDRLAVARTEAAALLPGVPSVAVSARTGEGVKAIRGRIADVAASIRAEPEATSGPAVLHVDRAFTLRGIGTVVTGTLRSGAIGAGERLEILPGGRTARARSLQVHGAAVERAEAGQRVAVNLAGVELADTGRGDVVASADSGLRPTYRLDAELRLEPGTRPLAGRRIQVHHGTRDVPGRVVSLDDERLAQLRLEAPLLARPGDRFVLREIAPPNTIGGGSVLDPHPVRHGPGPATQRLRAIRDRDLESVVAEEEEEERASAADAAPAPGGAPELDRVALLVAAVLEADRDEPRPPAAIAERLGIDQARVDRALAALVDAGRAVRLSPQVYFAPGRLDPLCERAIALARERGAVTLPALRDELETSRKYAQAILEHLDATGVTVRHGDRRVLRRPVAK